MRPDAIRKFDLFFLASVAMGLASGLLNFDAQVAALAQAWTQVGLQDQAESFIIGITIVGFAVNMLLWYLASRKRQGWVKWVLAAFVAFSAVSIVSALASDMGSLSLTGAIALLLKAIATVFLFMPDAKAWFSGQVS
ncbi:hypothetical protein [Aurantiacibacter sp. MUD61]|uniref:hypothetical protein n=1 Tax=Aurantiacibacter sp. MUD61 TaxID=3009083 RepID=UPI0022F0335F|nr:hypothetical protein [Aurantiacibacter sp. MUD61]